MLSTFKLLKNSNICVNSQRSRVTTFQSKLNSRTIQTKENPDSIKPQQLTDEELKRELRKHEEKLSELTKSYTDFEQDLHDIKYLLDDVHFKIDQIK